MTQKVSGPREAGTTYFVYADYGYVSERKIAQSTNFGEMKRVFDDETSNITNMECSVSIELASFATNGEYLVHDQQAPEEDWPDDSNEDAILPLSALHF